MTEPANPKESHSIISDEMRAAISLRPIQSGDECFLKQVYASTRQDIAEMPWTDEQKQAICDSQFEAQHWHYQTHFPTANYEVVMFEDQPVGRLYVDYREDEIHIIDIAILPEFRGRGIGASLMYQLIDKSETRGVPLRLRVQPDRPARIWYERLGFNLIADEQINWYMEKTKSNNGCRASTTHAPNT